jgi:glutamine cyclotransferase
MHSGDTGSGSEITLTKVKEVPIFNSAKAQVLHINELEFAEGLIFANVWYKDYIAVIDPESGIVVKYIDMSALYPKVKHIHLKNMKKNKKGSRIHLKLY